MKQVFDIVHRAQTAALAAAKPGVEAGSVDAARAQSHHLRGLRSDYKYFTHRLGTAWAWTATMAPIWSAATQRNSG